MQKKHSVRRYTMSLMDGGARILIKTLGLSLVGRHREAGG